MPTIKLTNDVKISAQSLNIMPDVDNVLATNLTPRASTPYECTQDCFLVCSTGTTATAGAARVYTRCKTSTVGHVMNYGSVSMAMYFAQKGSKWYYDGEGTLDSERAAIYYVYGVK